ncbi:MAG TPA: DUF2092 domain-containing protein [Thermoanaerobaculia bacterium]|nr:DUF2092 domain-containing protein [Thermoanaerobaculia bacterium]
MIPKKVGAVGALVLGLLLAAGTSFAQTAHPTPPAKKQAAPKAAAPRPVPTPESRAVEILKASCAKLAAAGSMSFTALGAYEVPSLWGPPLIYGRIYEVALQRPDKMAVITVGDGPRTEFYDDGKVMMSFHPAENLVAVADAPSSIDAALEKLFRDAGTYFPFTDQIVKDPWGDIASALTGAFYVSESKLIGGVTTDVVAYESNGVFIQTWIGRDDKLPYMTRAMFVDDPLQLRHSVQFTNWKLEPPLGPEKFTTTQAAKAEKIPFNHPKMKSDVPAPAKAPAGAKTPAARPKSATTPKPQ